MSNSRARASVQRELAIGGGCADGLALLARLLVGAYLADRGRGISGSMTLLRDSTEECKIREITKTQKGWHEHG